MVKCIDTSVSYGKSTVLRNISFSTDEGSITVIIGKNGSGKTTLLRAIGGMIPYSGSIMIEECENRLLSSAKRAKMIAVMPQLLHSPRISVRDLVAFGRQPYTGFTGILSENDYKIVDEVLAKTGLTELSDKQVNRISGGERQRAYFAMLTAQNTPILLLDEPSSHMDVGYSKNLMNFLKEERDAGKTIIAVFHDLNNSLSFADKIILVDSGRVYFQGSREEFYQNTYAEDLFGVKRYITMDNDSMKEMTIFL